MYQFIHIETYALSASTKVKPTTPKGKTPQERLAALGGANAPKGMDAFTQGSKAKKPKANVRDVIAEALRNEGDCNHVDAPQDPTYLVGDMGDMLGFIQEIERKVAAEKERTGKAPRKDMHVLLAGVASYPRELADADPKGYARWEWATVKWLREKYGDNLRVVLRHDDEEHPHLHFFVMDRERLNAKELHDGYIASAHLKGKDALSKESTQRFNDAMRDLQSDYYAKVGHGAGLLRDGPKRKRLDRATYKAVQREARERVALDASVGQAHADLLDVAGVEGRAAADLRRKAEQEAAALAVAQALVAAERAALNERSDQLQRDRAAVDADWTRAREAKATAERLEKKAEKDRAALDKQAIALERAKGKCDQEAEELRKRQTATKLVMQKYNHRLAGLGAVEDVRALVRKPELVAMVDYIDKHPEAREVLDFMRSDPEMAAELVENVRAFQAGPDALGVERPTWEPPQQVSIGDEYLASLEEDRAKATARDSGMEFGM